MESKDCGTGKGKDKVRLDKESKITGREHLVRKLDKEACSLNSIYFDLYFLIFV
jgi:hypothetical protein